MEVSMHRPVRLRLPASALAALVLLANLASPQNALADGWPEQTVRIITAGSGASADVTARLLAEKLSVRWKQPVVVENRPGAGGILAVQGMIEAKDGHTLMFGSHSVFTVNQLLYEKLPYDPVRDVAALSLAVEDFLGVVVTPSLKIGSLRDLAEAMREKPGQLNFYSVPGSPYLSFLAWQRRAGINAAFINYKNPTSAVADLLEGRIQVAVLPLALILGQSRAGTLKLLAVTNPVRSPAAPETPTAAESGFPEFTFGGLLGLFGPKETPNSVRDQVARDVGAILREPEVAQRLTTVGLVTRGSTPVEFDAVLAEQRARWATIARENDVKPAGR
jgi:tripartite-type tricarboxylate transporter receptor subunit TctC